MKDITIHYKVEVKAGPEVNVYLLDRANCEKYNKTYEYDEAIREHESVRVIEEEVKLEEAGEYCLIIENLSPTQTAKVYVFLEGKRVFPKTLIVLAIVVAVAIVVLIHINKGKLKLCLRKTSK